MTDGILIGIVILIVALGVGSGVKHFRGEGGCCGGGTYKARRKKLKQVEFTRTFRVEGMHCQHCVNRVMEALQDLDGVSAQVRLKKGLVIVSADHSVEEALIRQTLDHAGYPAR